MFNILFQNLIIGMKIHIWIPKCFLTIQIRTIPYYWKYSLQYLLCPRILRTTLVYVVVAHLRDWIWFSCFSSRLDHCKSGSPWKTASIPYVRPDLCLHWRTIPNRRTRGRSRYMWMRRKNWDAYHTICVSHGMVWCFHFLLYRNLIFILFIIIIYTQVKV